MSTGSPQTEMGGGQAERTALAWSRTLVGLSAVIGFLCVHAALDGAATVVVIAGGAVAALTLVTSSIVTRRSWSAAAAALAGQRPAARPVAIAVMTAVTGAVAVISMVLVLTGWR